MIIIGLTGSIGMGKSTTAKLFAENGVPVWDADNAVHRLYAPGGAAVDAVLKRFPDAMSADGGIDREKLSAALGAREDFAALEAIVHPLVREDQAAFIDAQRAAGADLVILDIPLLVEGGDAELFQEIIVCTADLGVRRARVLERPGMTEAKLEAILARQASEEDRLAHATHVIRTDKGVPAARQRVQEVLRAIREKHRLSSGAEPG